MTAKFERIERSVLHSVQAEEGAVFYRWQGAIRTAHLGDVLKEYNATRSGVAMDDTSNMLKYEISGTDATEVLQSIFSNSLIGMKEGSVKFGIFPDEEGHVVDDGTVFRFTPDRYWVLTNNRINGIADAITRAGRHRRVAIADISDAIQTIQVHGPESTALLQRLTSVALHELGWFHLLPEEVDVAGIPAVLARVGYSGEIGYELHVRRERAEPLWRAVRAAGATPCGVKSAEIARIEAGFIYPGNEYEPHQTCPLDLSLEQFVALDDDRVHFVGKSRLKERRGTSAKHLMAVTFSGDRLPGRFADVFDGASGARIGIVTSVVRSPRLGGIGLAVLDRANGRDGTEVFCVAESDDGEAPEPTRIDGVVRVPPLYNPMRMRAKKVS